MLIKSVDDKSKRVKLLEELQLSSWLDARQKKWLREELQRLRKGMQGEQESAHYLNEQFKDGENHAVLHDLRIVIDDEVAQIDHLLINRTGHLFLIETKNYACNLEINERGEFTVDYDGDRFGIPSPLEQSRRHERLLLKLFDRLEIPLVRVGQKPDIHHVVMMSPKVVIKRPDEKAFDSSFLIKSDQFPTWHNQFVNSIGPATILKAGLNLRSSETIKEWAEKIKRQHRPPNLFELPDFMQPKPVQVAHKIPPPMQQVVLPKEVLETPAVADMSLARKRICAHCKNKISYEEGLFCWNRPKQFGGLQYCRDHQALFK